ncbi:MAG: outer membrane beta-barrel protein [Sphingobacteriia bacterium]
MGPAATASGIASYRWARYWRSSLRAEYYSDPDAANLTSLTHPGAGVVLYGSSLGLDYLPTTQAMLRLEARYLQAGSNVFPEEGGTTRQRWLLTAALSIKIE